MKRILYLLFLLAIIFTVISLPFSVMGRPFRVKRIPDEGKNFGCFTCHTGPRIGKILNPFGQDYEKIAIEAGDKYVPELGKLDSDKDGFTNDQEFDANTNPGDPNSKPSKGSIGGADAELTKAIDRGRTLFNDPKLGKTNMSCNSCHPGGGTNRSKVMDMDVPEIKGAAATFPKFKASAKRVITLQQMNNMCIEMIMKGKPLPLDSDDSIALTAYVTSLSNGIPIKVGAK